MTQPGQPAECSATLSILGILAIPFLAVSSAALMAGPISSADSVQVSTGVAAAMAGSVMGLSVVRVMRLAMSGMRVAALATAQWLRSASKISLILLSANFIVVPADRPALVVDVSSLGRRGPPSGL